MTLVDHGRKPLGILLADPDDLTREGLRALLGRDPRFRILGESGDLSPALTARLRPDMVVLDPARRGAQAPRLIDAIRTALPESRIALLTSPTEPEFVLATLRAGALSYLLKTEDQSSGFLREALALSGRYGATVLDGRLRERWREEGVGLELRLRGRPRAGLLLEARDEAVLRRLGAGERREQIARAESLSLRTVDRIIARLALRLQATSRQSLLLRAQRLGLLPEQAEGGDESD